MSFGKNQPTPGTLLAAALLVLAALACNSATPTPAPVDMASPTAVVAALTNTPAPAATQPPPTSAPAPSETPTAEPPTATLPPSSTWVPPTKTPTPPPTQTPVPTKPPLAITSFIVDAEDLPGGGKRLIFKWATTGAKQVSIYSGSQMRFPQWWASLPPNGVHTAEIGYTYYRNPSMQLVAYDEQNNQVSQSVIVDWACKYSYFFTPEPVTCPAFQAAFTGAAEEPFERGRMIWLQEVRIGDFTASNQILVLYNNGDMARYDDTWTEAEPDRDPSITPPGGLFQPIRGFGKLWRANETVRNGLGWALAEEQGYTAALQQQAHESLVGPLYLRTLNNQIITLPSGWGNSGRWQLMTP